jgi:hypothetical protein
MMWRTDRHRRRRPADLIAVPALALSLLIANAGCQPSKPYKASDTTTMDTIADEIRTTLAERRDVVTAKVTYQDNLEASGSAAVNVTLKSGTDAETVIDDAVRLVWQSRLNPLHIIRVGVVYPDNVPPGTIRYVDPDKEKADLDRKYGPHPAK